ncbi:1508_t:CDS:2, partial [Ambispora leptoticha]
SFTIISKESFSDLSNEDFAPNSLALETDDFFLILSNESFTSNAPDEVLKNGFRNKVDSDGSSNKNKQFENLVEDLFVLFHKQFDKLEDKIKLGTSLKTHYDKNAQLHAEFRSYLQDLQDNNKYKTFLGFLYHNGIILEQDHLMAYKLYNECAHNEDSRAQCLLGHTVNS